MCLGLWTRGAEVDGGCAYRGGAGFDEVCGAHGAIFCGFGTQSNGGVEGAFRATWIDDSRQAVAPVETDAL